MKHKLVTFDGKDLGIVYLYGPIPYIGYAFVYNKVGYKILGIQGIALDEPAKGEIEVILIVADVPIIYA